MAPGGERPDLEALRELDEVLRHLENELAGWRRRALGAESQLAESGGGGGGDGSPVSARVEEENHALEQRLVAAKGRVGELLERLRFLEEQQDHGGNGQ